jgi:hypothetical protein
MAVTDDPPPGRAGGKLTVMPTGAIWSPAARITGPVSLILMSPPAEDQVRSDGSGS